MVSVLIFFAGVVAGYYVEKLLRGLDSSIAAAAKQRRWDAAKRALERFQELSPALQIVQAAGRTAEFTEAEIVVTVERKYSAPQPVKDLLAKNQKHWAERRLKNNRQVGVFEVIPHRLSDVPGERSHILLIRGQNFDYFNFLASNQMLLNGDESEKLLLEPLVGERHYFKPSPHFPNPLSVGLALFCEGGGCLIMTRRTPLQSSGGWMSAGAIFNAVGETVNPRDTKAGSYQGHCLVSPWNTARRALVEEMGFSASDVNDTTIVLHSLVYDSRILDYKFFGYAVVSLSRAGISQRWESAPDKAEAKELFFEDVSSAINAEALIERIVTHQDNWSPEASLCTSRALLHAGKITPQKFESALQSSSPC